MNKGTKLYSIVNNKCPKCHEGQFFNTNSSYDLQHFSEMPDVCPVCGQTYMPEPGFYYGAMYVSYGINVAIFLTVWVASNVLFSDGLGVWWLVLASIIAGLALMPVSFRWARLIWINFFVKYDAQWAARNREKLPVT